MTKKEIAAAFSNGRFELVYEHLADTVKWTVAGEQSFEGKAAVMEQCRQTAAYFQSVTTYFVTENIIGEGSHVAVSGTAAFSRNNKQLAFVSACDIYTFTSSGLLESISSYCVRHREQD